MQRWLGCGFRHLNIVPCSSYHMQVLHASMPSFSCILISHQLNRMPVIMQKWLGCGPSNSLQTRSHHTELNHAVRLSCGHMLVSPQLHKAPHFLEKWLGSVFHSRKAMQGRCLSAVAFQDAASQAGLQDSKKVINRAQSHGNDSLEMGTIETPINSIDRVRTKSNKKRTANSEPELKRSTVMPESVESLEELLKELELSASKEDPRIGALCLRLAQLCVSKDENPEKILIYGQRALKILGCPEKTLECVTCLEVIGCAYYKKGEFEKAVAHLERAVGILEKLKRTVKQEDIGSLLYAVQALLGQANMSLGRQEEALVNFQDALAINERVLKPNDPNLGKSYQQVAEAFMQAQDLDEALSLCLKALPIYIDCYGSSSSQVAELRKLLSLVYYDLDDFEKALSEHQLARPIFEDLGKSEEVASIDLASGEAYLCLDMYAEAICKLNDVIKETTHVSNCHGQALVLIAKAHAGLKKDKIAIMYCNQALDVLKNKEPSAIMGASLVELGLVLRQLKEIEQALSVFEMALGIYERFPKEQAAVAFIEAQIGFLYLGSERAIDAMPYLEACIAKNESMLGLESKELLDVYNHLGVAYIQLGKFDEALIKIEAAKAIAEQNNLSKDPATVKLYKNLVHVYTALGRTEDALLCQQLLVETIKKTGLQTDVSLEEADKNLKDSTKMREPVSQNEMLL